ncbi:recombinase RecT [uncultured Pseudoalteromonas sp.]|uniref:recombinase RecT n=1 Tax=uncultured Pseudoalteromonas sp. TaxID=114053 RepID=UPI002594A463|nr:recombinase RecT [uncultured Pseudoalteromonas sp.]
MSKALTQLATRLSMDEQEVENVMLNTVMPSGKPVTREQFASFIAVANEYSLNPLVKEIYAFPAKGGGIQPIVSIDGWLRIINSHHDFDGMVFNDIRDGANLIAVTCRIFKKNCQHPIEVTEYMEECKRTTDTWKQWPARMLRHKATIQAGRYAFGISGIIDPDEAERFKDSGAIVTEKEVNPANKPAQLDYYPSEHFNANFPKWAQAIESGKMSADQVIGKVQSKAKLTEDQINTIHSVQVKGAA